MNRKFIKYIFVLLITVVIIPGLSLTPAIPGDAASFEKVTDVTLGPLTADNYDIHENALVGVLTSNEGTVSVVYEGSAELRASVDSTPKWLDRSDLEIRLGDQDWEPLGDNNISLSLEDKNEVSYELKYDAENQSKVPSPGTYYISLGFSLIQTGGCNDPVIEISQNYLGPDENPKFKLTSSCGPIGKAKVFASPGGTKYTETTGANAGETPNFGNLKPDDDIDLDVDADGDDSGVTNLAGGLDFDFDGDNVDGDFQVLVSGAIGPGEDVILKVKEPGPGQSPGDPVEGADISGYATGTTDSSGEFTFTLPEVRDFSKVITVGVGSAAQDATLKFDYNFTP